MRKDQIEAIAEELDLATETAANGTQATLMGNAATMIRVLGSQHLRDREAIAALFDLLVDARSQA